MIALQNVDLAYSSPGGGCSALTDICLTVPKEKTLSVVGVSGGGKSSLLHVMAGLLRPTAGKVTYNGAELVKPNAEIAVVFQDYGLFPWKTLAQNVGLPLKLRGDKLEKEKAEAMLGRLGIAEHRHKRPRQLSGGQRQRAAIGRAIIGSPKVLLLDEPFSALDPLTRLRLRQDISRLCAEERLTCVLVTHSIEEALIMGDSVAVFAPGGQYIAAMVENEGRTGSGFLSSADCSSRSEQIRRVLEFGA